MREKRGKGKKGRDAVRKEKEEEERGREAFSLFILFEAVMTGNEPCLEHTGPLIDAILFCQPCCTLLLYFCFSVAEMVFINLEIPPAPLVQSKKKIMWGFTEEI